MTTNPTKDRTRRKPKTDPEDSLSQRNLLLVLEKKKRCNARAQLLVEEFIDLVTDADRFLDKVSVALGSSMTWIRV